LATTLPDHLQTQTGKLVYTEGVLRTISAGSPHVLRRFSAIECGKGVEILRRCCGKGGKYILIVWEDFTSDPGVIKAFIKSGFGILKKS